MSISLILLAGGSGTRLGSSIPKQFLKLAGKEIALYSFDLFLSLSWINEIIVVVNPQYQGVFKTMSQKRVVFAAPGMRRQDSVEQGLSKASATSEWIAIHDSARPFVTKEEVIRLWAGAQEAGSAALGTPAKNTIKQVDAQGYVIKTLERETLWEMQTPQILRRDILEEGLRLTTDQKITVTDDVAFAELLGRRVKLVPGLSSNFKITTAEDLKLAQGILS